MWNSVWTTFGKQENKELKQLTEKQKYNKTVKTLENWEIFLPKSVFAIMLYVYCFVQSHAAQIQFEVSMAMNMDSKASNVPTITPQLLIRYGIDSPLEVRMDAISRIIVLLFEFVPIDKGISKLMESDLFWRIWPLLWIRCGLPLRYLYISYVRSEKCWKKREDEGGFT